MKAMRELRELSWCDRHHVVESRGNLGAPKNRRAYFDHLPAVRVKEGELTDMLLVAPYVVTDLPGHEVHLHRRYLQFPQFWRRGRGQLGSPSPVSTRRGSDAGDPGAKYTYQDGAVAQPASPVPRPEIAHLLTAVGRLHGKTEAELAALLEEEERQGSKRSAGASPRRGGRRKFERPRATLDGNQLAMEDDELRIFTDWVRSKHTHSVSLWRKLDTDGSMTLHKGEFSQGLKKLKYPGNIDRLWSTIDRDTTGNISFLEFAPESALALAKFKRWAQQKFGGMRGLFTALDEDRSGSITFEEFTNGCATAGLPERLKDSVTTLFMLLDSDQDSAQGIGSISEAELRFMDTWRPPAYLWEEPNRKALEDLRQAILAKHNHNHLLAWRRALDKDNSMKVSYEEFLISCKLLQKKGINEAAPACGIVAVYVAIDQDRSGWFTLRDWSQDAFDMLRSFNLWWKAEYQTLARFVKAAESMHDEDDDNRNLPGISFSKFSRMIKSLGFTYSQRVGLFEALLSPSARQSRQGGGRLQLNDLSFLASWDPDAEVKEDERWCQMVQRRMTLNLERTSSEPAA